jgi:transketolase
MKKTQLESIARYVRSLILKASTQAGSGHPTSSLSATDLMVALLFGGVFRTDLAHPEGRNNDRLVFSKGHASPLYYSLWVAAGGLPESMMTTYRQFGSPLEGHPVATTRYVDAATGSLGQGLSIAAGMALNARYLEPLPYRTYVLLGDSEMAEGAQWEALQLAAHYRLDNLVGILDVNRLGQRGETMCGDRLEIYQRRVEAFGWSCRLVDGHSMEEALDAYRWAASGGGQPCMIIARTIKGKGVSFLEDKDGWHGKTLDPRQLDQALRELGEVDSTARGKPARPKRIALAELQRATEIDAPDYTTGDSVPTRKAFGNALKRIYPKYPDIVSLDGEVGNSTYAQTFCEAWPERFFEMYVAEQNMVGMAAGLSTRGRIPFVSTFAAFMTRAFDQIRMAPYSEANIKFVGSHAGVSIGEDGPSQMGLEDIAMFRGVLDSVVLYPCDAMSTERLVEAMAKHTGIAYLRTTRGGAPVIYDVDEPFAIGGSKVLRESADDRITVIAAGITLHEALAAWDALRERGIALRVIDLYSVKPLDIGTLRKAARETGALLTVEDHYEAGGIGEAVAAALAEETGTVVRSLCVRKRPRSGTTAQLLEAEGISAAAIMAAADEMMRAADTPSRKTSTSNRL